MHSNLLVERGGRVGGDGRYGQRIDETNRTHQLLHPSQLALVLGVCELDDQARRRALSTHVINRQNITFSVIRRFDYLHTDI